MVHMSGSYPSRLLGKEIPFDILLPKVSSIIFPAAAGSEDGPYRSLFFLHGACDSPQTLLLYTDIASLCDKYSIAVIMPNGQNSFYLDEPGGQPWNSAIFDEMYDYLHKIFPLSCRREDNYIGGISMGGYGALYTALTRPEKFSSCFSLSGALDIKTAVRYVQACQVPQPRFLTENIQQLTGSSYDLCTYITAAQPADSCTALRCSLDLYCGRQDPFRHALDDIEKACIAAGWPHEVARGAGRHDWDFWNRHLEEAIKKL